MLLLSGWMTMAAGSRSIRYVNAYGRKYVFLRDVARYYGMTLAVGKSRCELRSEYSRIVFEYDRREGCLNGVEVHYHFAPFIRDGEPYISEKDFLLLIDPILRYAPLNAHPMRVIMIDPGHGGYDKGASGALYHEKDLVLSLSKKLRDALRRKGYYVVMTRGDDRYLSLSDRTRKCAAGKADLFISVHCNAAGSSVAAGVETFATTPAGAPSTADVKPSHKKEKGNQFDKNNTRLAYEVQKSLVNATKANDRGVRHARFYVLKNASCPAVLVEAGFVSNGREERLLGRNSYQNVVAEAIAAGVVAYHKQLNRK